MNDRQIRTLATYERIASTLADTKTPLPPEAVVVLERLTATLVAIRLTGDDQYVARHERSVTRARWELECMRKDEMLPLARLTLRLFAGETAITSALKVPHKRAPTDDMLAAAALMVKTLRPHRSVLRAAQIDPARLDAIQQQVRRLRQAFKAAYGSVADRAVPTRQLRELFSSAHLDVGILDAFRGIGAKSADVREWNRTKKIGKRIGRPRAPRQRKSTAPLNA
ncbi:MAG: hypothetical protein JWM95_1217 [Gemmatimonadetes bacterium]|nr:hypothetical protein [Gemmatimonadota bacterium]